MKPTYIYNESNVIIAALNRIRNEMDRLYWNKNQKEMISPFDNSGETYQNDTFTVRAYDWNDNILPNFEYKDLRVTWYKHSNRGVYACCDHKLTFNDIETMIQECFDSMKKDFEKKEQK